MNRGHFPSDEAVIKLPKAGDLRHLWTNEPENATRRKDCHHPSAKPRADSSKDRSPPTRYKALAQPRHRIPRPIRPPPVNRLHRNLDRLVRRTAKAIEAPAWVDFPGAAQVVQLRRTRTIKSRKHVEVAYLICSLPMTDAQPEVVAAWIQGHWGIENRLHWVRDVVFDEDRHQLRTGNGPQVMATLRNLAISLIRLFHGTGTSIASTTRSLSRQPKRAIRLLTQTPT